MEIIKLPNGTEAVQAEYKKVIEDYEGNPYIEALPEILSPPQVIERLANYPKIRPEERLLDSHVRIHLLQRVFQYFQPLEEHIRLENTLSTMLRNGYVDRNPFSLSYMKKISREGGEEYWKNASINQSSSSKSLTFLGISGSGKTSSLERLLALTPQVIVHSEYKGKDFNRYQLSHLRCETPYDGSLKALCLQFFANIDSILGTDYMRKYGNGHRSTNVMIPIISKLLQALGTGLLIIDEIQHLSLAKSGGGAMVLNFFTTLINTANIPICLVGTPKSLGILTSEFRQARRGINGVNGSVLWDRLKKGQSWELFVTGLWRYQWTRNFVDYSQELSDILYEETQGIPDVVVKLFMMTQVRAISTGKEKITGSLIRKVANEQMRLIRPVLDLLKNGRTSQLSQYNDIILPDVAGFVSKEKSQIEIKGLVEESRKRAESRQSQIQNMKDEAVVRLQLLGLPEKKASDLIDQVLTGQHVPKELNILVQLAYQNSLANELVEEKTVSKPNGDLRTIIQQGKNKNLSAFDALKEAGMIRDDYRVVGE